MATDYLQSPVIDHLGWGKMSIQSLGDGKDFKLWPGGGRVWNWAETATHHVPGIQIDDVVDLVEHGATEIILSRGMLLALQTCPETIHYLKSKNIKIHQLETRKAVRMYNQLANAGIRIGGLFHSTC